MKRKFSNLLSFTNLECLLCRVMVHCKKTNKNISSWYFFLVFPHHLGTEKCSKKQDICYSQFKVAEYMCKLNRLSKTSHKQFWTQYALHKNMLSYSSVFKNCCLSWFMKFLLYWGNISSGMSFRKNEKEGRKTTRRAGVSVSIHHLSAGNKKTSRFRGN